MSKVLLIGAGQVGATAAYALLEEQAVSEILLYDIDRPRLEAQVMDLTHASAFSRGIFIRRGEYTDLEDDDIVVITCGIAQKVGQSRLDLLATNAGIVREIAQQIRRQQKNVYLLVVTNPVDVLTFVAYRESGLPAERVFGSGTVLDSARLRNILSQRLQVNPRQINAFVLGEHGDSSFAALHSANVAGYPLRHFPGYDPIIGSHVEEQIRQAAAAIIAGKGATYYGIGSVVAGIVRSIVGNQNKIMPVSHVVSGAYGLQNLSIGLPSRINRSGTELLPDFPLSEKEHQQLQASAAVIVAALSDIGYGAQVGQ